jgi:hypothetical protein
LRVEHDDATHLFCSEKCREIREIQQREIAQMKSKLAALR